MRIAFLAHDGGMNAALRPLIAPGARLLRRDPRTVQIGTNPGTIVSLRPGTLELLRLLNGARDLDRLQALLLHEVPQFTGHVREILDPLISAGAVLPRRAHALICPTYVIDHDPPATDFARLVSQGLGARPPAVACEPELRIIVSTGEPHRLVPESLVTSGVVHLPIVLDERHVVIGPLVIPGSTPCLNCFDLNRAQWQPHWPVFVAQFGHTRLESGVSRAVQFRAVAEILDRLLGNDSATGLIGQRITVTAHAADQRVDPFGFHPACHCHLLAA